MTLFAVGSCNGLGNHLECFYDTTTMTYAIFDLLRQHLMNFEKLILLRSGIAVHFLCPLFLILCLLAQGFSSGVQNSILLPIWDGFLS